MAENVHRYIKMLGERYPKLAPVLPEVDKVYSLLEETYAAGGKLMIAGNGGSCADSEHIVGELMKSFLLPRRISPELKENLRRISPDLGGALGNELQQGLPAIALTGHNGLTTAYANDCNPVYVYAQQLLGYGKKGDAFLGISTSGNSQNVLAAAVTAKAMGIRVIGLLGRDGGAILPLCDAAVVVPETETFKIQELHLPVYHALCLELEDHFFGEPG
jgi:D-sedoheptulose 7-phosphate isomerase